jgi:hypothetical protein
MPLELRLTRPPFRLATRTEPGEGLKPAGSLPASKASRVVQSRVDFRVIARPETRLPEATLKLSRGARTGVFARLIPALLCAGEE